MIYKCKLCGDEIVPEPYERHKMQYCKCGKSYVDAEETYMRLGGEIEPTGKYTTKEILTNGKLIFKGLTYEEYLSKEWVRADAPKKFTELLVGDIFKELVKKQKEKIDKVLFKLEEKYGLDEDTDDIIDSIRLVLK